MAQIFVGLMAEGTTDHRFFEPIVEKVFTQIVFGGRGQIDIDLKVIQCDKGGSFIDFVNNASKFGHKQLGINILVIHTDADDDSSEDAYRNRIQPALNFIQNQSDDTHCKNLAALVPVHMTESWMLADKGLLIKQIGTKKSESELGINGDPESFRNPKIRIEEAIRIGRAEFPKKLRNSLKISDLYSYLGQAIDIENLRKYKSFLDFEGNIKKVLFDLNLLRE
ncbi:DUF4276 family protein [Belliella sp. DSM 107340]|uniref:DUF4276 family protein n=1 Tax=Belliella calami TaxID=2923436 RepID=A0ABS9US01_9BACT|nr:DUF4276 family protein [Belliella calami]MCH7399376.1 DUF4276 family protein [Belliella calami]